ncbi:MAG: NAD(P)H-dependent oxidoreductase subunit E [Bryobacteraceae bacterium]|nr:NAD(P)H-dependent oxidoreductase subunit E [Bryobacteraceae bacterium]
MKACRCSDGSVYVKRDRHVFVVCGGEHCRCAGSKELLDYLKQAPVSGDVDVRIAESRACIGHCAAAPAMVEDGQILRWVSPRRLKIELLRLGITG